MDDRAMICTLIVTGPMTSWSISAAPVEEVENGKGYHAARFSGRATEWEFWIEEETGAS